MSGSSFDRMMSFGEHLEIMRKMLIRIVAVIIVLAAIIFYFRNETFTVLLAPRHSNFCTFRIIEYLAHRIGWNFYLDECNIPLISTELPTQFMTHIRISCVLAVLLASPYIVLELFRFISPALYESEKKYSYVVTIIIYALFIFGLLMSYFILFPISYYFLATYQIDESITSTVTIDSYVSTFMTLTFMIGVVFQLPVFAYVLGKVGFIDAKLLSKYRSYAFVIIMIIAAIITPPDIFTMIIVVFPVYGLYELSILVLRRIKS